MDGDNQAWVDSVLKHTPGYEAEMFSRYAQRLLGFARTRLPGDLSGRVDEEDIVQSVFRSFFLRNQSGEFDFEDSLDVWSLLAAMTYRKVINAVQFHHRDRRSTTREFQAADSSTDKAPDVIDKAPTPEEFNILVDYLRWILDKLNPAQREIIQHRLEGFSIAEIADKVQLSQRTVKRALNRARDLASEKIAEDS